jgi:putative phosphoribosyl transferase
MPLRHMTTEGSRLAGRLAGRSLSAPLVLALTPESVPVASDIARRLGGKADRIFVEGMDIPSSHGRCIGAVSETGHLALACAGGGDAATEEAFAREMLNYIVRLVERRLASMPGNGLPDSAGRNVILVADGLAGGATMVAAIRGVRAQHPLRLVAAVGVAPSRTLDRIREEADETVALSTVAKFGDVGRVRRADRRATPAHSR